MAIVNQLSFSNRRRDAMVNQRNGFTYIANIVVLSFALLFFAVLDNSVDQFRYLSIIALALGFFTSVFYIS